MKNLVVPDIGDQINPATSICIKYVVVGIFWIVFSDSLLLLLGQDSIIWRVTHIHIVKGVLFIGVTAALLFYLVQNLNHSLIATQKNQRVMFHLNPQPLLMVDVKSFRLYMANDAAQRLLGFELSELLVMEFDQILTANERENFIKKMRSQFSSIMNLGQWSVKDKMANEFIVQINASKIFFNGKEKLMLLLYDVTTQIKAENKLRTFEDMMEQRINQRTNKLFQLNGELHFRIRQAEQVNEELIFINEKLQIATKRMRDNGANRGV